MNRRLRVRRVNNAMVMMKNSIQTKNMVLCELKEIIEYSMQNYSDFIASYPLLSSEHTPTSALILNGIYIAKRKINVNGI